MKLQPLTRSLLLLAGILFFTGTSSRLLAQTSPLDLLPTNHATHTVQNSGNWSNPSTWAGGTVPSALAKVVIPPGLTLTVDGEISTRIKIIRIQGKLAFATTSNTALNVETIVQDMMGELEIGTASNPVPAGTTAKITFIDEGDIVLSTAQWEKGMVLMGKTVMYGAQKDSWHTLAANPAAGATSITLAAAPSGWNAGDRIVITGTDPVDATSDEVATVQSISGSTINLVSPLTKNHLPPASDLRVHVANLNRNILLESENPTGNMGLDRGHVMWMHTRNVDVNYVRFHQMGRTRKDIQVDDWFIDENDQFVTGPKTNVRGRYSVHFHRGGVNKADTPARVRGCVVEDDPGWAYTNHSSNVDFDNNVSYNVVGGAFQTEAGDEVGSFRNNIAIRTVNSAYPLRNAAPDDAPDVRENSQDFAFQGDGFWIHGGGVGVTGNVASGCSGHGFIYWPEGLIEPGEPTNTYFNTFLPSYLGLPNNINVVPGEDALATGWYSITDFKDNQVYSATIGLATFYLHTTFFQDIDDYDPNYIATVHSTFENFTAWNVNRDGIQLNYTERVTFQNIRLVNNNANASTRGIWASHFRAMNKQVFNEVDIQGLGTGFLLPTQGEVTVNCGYLKNGTNFSVPAPAMAPRDMRIEGVTTAPDPAFGTNQEINMEVSFTSPGDKYTAYFFLPDKTILNYGPFANQRLFFNEQAASYVPLPSDAAPYTFEDTDRIILGEFATKSNQQLQSDYAMSFGGSLLPSNASTSPGIVGGQIAPWQSNTVLNVPVCINSFPENEPNEINNCLNAASNKVAGPLLVYTHPVSTCPPLSVSKEALPEARLVFYPNPTSGQFSIAGPLAPYHVDILDISGSLVGTYSATTDLMDFDITYLPTGMYFVRAVNMRSGVVQVGKIVKRN